MRKTAILLVTLFLLSGCLSVDLYAKRQLKFTNYAGTLYPPRPANHKVELFFNDDVPEQEYEVIGEVNGQITDDLRPVLMARARQVGGDGAIDIKISKELASKPSELRVEPGILQGEQVPVYTPGYSIEIFNVSAKIIKYK